MSASSESDSSNRHGCDSDGEFSVASSYGSEVQDCRKRPRQPQIIGSAWVLRGQITMDQLHANSDSMTAGPEGDVENDDRITKINTRLRGLLGAQFEILFGKLIILSHRKRYVLCGFLQLDQHFGCRGGLQYFGKN
jgi:hypothetical protein